MGILLWNDKYDIAQFEYNPTFISSGLEPSPLVMPSRAGVTYSFAELNRETYRGLPGLFADSLPDTYGRALFDRWLSLVGRHSENAIESLCFLGKRCMGALEFEPAVEIPYDSNTQLEIESLVNVAGDALIQKEKFGTNLCADKRAAIAEIVRLGTSAGVRYGICI